MTEKEAVQSLGEQIGYGRMMQLAEQCWREALVAQGLPPGGEHSTGPCVVFLVPCQCVESFMSPSQCDWCCGSGRVTQRVRKAQGS